MIFWMCMLILLGVIVRKHCVRFRCARRAAAEKRADRALLDADPDFARELGIVEPLPRAVTYQPMLQEQPVFPAHVLEQLRMMQQAQHYPYLMEQQRAMQQAPRCSGLDSMLGSIGGAVGGPAGAALGGLLGAYRPMRKNPFKEN